MEAQGEWNDTNVISGAFDRVHSVYYSRRWRCFCINTLPRNVRTIDIFVVLGYDRTVTTTKYVRFIKACAWPREEVRLPPGLRGVDTASRVNAYKASLLCPHVHVRVLIRSKRRGHRGREKEQDRGTKTYRPLIARRDFTTRRRAARRRSQIFRLFADVALAAILLADRPVSILRGFCLRRNLD